MGSSRPGRGRRDDAAPGTLITVTATPPVAGALTGGAGPVADALLSRLDTEHPTLCGLPGRERLLAAAWLESYRQRVTVG